MTPKANRWQLPDGVDQVLPPRALQLETLSREILDLYGTWGYTLIKTPLIEFLESLHIVPSHELQLSTFTLVDQLSGRNMGVRSDITSQAARIDAHVLQQQGPTRLCYADTVLRTRPKGQFGSRSPRLAGAELYGHSGVESDLEVISLLLHTLTIAGIESPLLALGHSHICRELLQATNLSSLVTAELFEALQNKATTDVNRWLALNPLPAELAESLRQLPNLHGDTSVLKEARALFGSKNDTLQAALGQLDTLVTLLQQRFPQQQIYLDLCELRGYDYHTGVTFSAYVEGHGEAIANGGRYDGIGAAFGRARAATGFDTDLMTLLQLSKRKFAAPELIFAPAVDDARLQQAVASLRSGGQRVVQAFAGQTEGPAQLGCSQQLVADGKDWKVVPVQ
jgi:ATP phosphoribosyltransferase regulatory subunit